MAKSNDWRAEFDAVAELDATASAMDKAARGRQLEKIFYAMVDEAGLRPRSSYRPTGEEVDGSFLISGHTMLLEVKWRQDPQPASALYQFMGKVNGKLVGTIGLFVSMSGFSTDAVDALLAGKQLNLVLMDGDDVRAVRRGDIGITDAIQRKLRAAAETGTPFVPLVEAAATGEPHSEAGASRELILVEGPFDERIVTTLIREWGTRSGLQAIVQVGGLTNFAPSAEALLSQFEKAPRLIVIVDGDGQPEATRRQLTNDLTQRAIAAEVLVVEPTLKAALGIFKPGEFSASRQRFLMSDTNKLLEMVKVGIKSRSIGDGSGAVELLTTLGIMVPGAPG
jgi:Restriction endonuclease